MPVFFFEMQTGDSLSQNQRESVQLGLGVRVDDKV